MATVAVLLARKGSEVFRVHPSASFDEVAVEMRSHASGSVLVATKNSGTLTVSDVTGIVSERDLVAAVASHGAAAATALPAADLAAVNLTFCSPETPIGDLATEMTARRIRHIPVADGDRVVGVVSIGDAVAWHLSELAHTTEALTEYVQTGRG